MDKLDQVIVKLEEHAKQSEDNKQFASSTREDKAYWEGYCRGIQNAIAAVISVKNLL